MNTPWEDVVEGFKQAFQLILHGNSLVVHAMLLTLWLAVFSTAVGALVGVPCGSLIGTGKSRVARLLLGLATALTRLPPVAVGVFVLLLGTESSLWGGGPLADVPLWMKGDFLAQSLLAIPIVIVLTASAVQGVPAGLLEQAGAYGATRRQRAVLAVREARRAVIAGIVVAMGVTITAIGAIVIVDPTYQTLALSAFQSFVQVQPGEQPPFDPNATVLTASYALAIAYATVLMGLFVVIAGVLTWLQERRAGWLVGVRREPA